MQITFNRWSLDKNSRTPVSVNPKEVSSTEEYCPAHPGNDVTEALPAATRIKMKSKTEYLVQGTLAQIVAALNEKEKVT